jgi:hypothetical protein
MLPPLENARCLHVGAASGRLAFGLARGSIHEFHSAGQHLRQVCLLTRWAIVYTCTSCQCIRKPYSRAAARPSGEHSRMFEEHAMTLHGECYLSIDNVVSVLACPVQA